MSDTTYTETSHKTLSLRLGLTIIFGVTLWRVVMLFFNRTDLFVDEAQYWFWGQNLDFGYYSKPPVIAWVIRFFNAISGSDSTFWIRVSAPLFHLATALMLMRTTRRLIEGDAGREIEPWVGVIFVTLPAASLSAVLMSTDTIQILFVTIAIWAFLGLTKRSSITEALILGVSLGIAFLTKYSVLFLLPGVGIAMLTLRSARIAWRDVLIAAIAGAIVVSPNLWWNFAHDAATVRHTESIAHWNGDGKGGGLVKHLLAALGFVGAQFGVVGPVIFYGMLWAAWRMIRGQSDDREKLLVWLSVPVVALITLQALFAKAYANWAVTAYAAGTILAVWLLHRLTKKGLVVSLVIGSVVAFLLPVLTVFAYDIKLPNGDLVMKRYVGRSAISLEIADIAAQANTSTIVADNRDILADLFYTLKGKPYHIYARNSGGFPKSYYEQNFSLPPTVTDEVLYIDDEPFDCTAGRSELIKNWSPDFGNMKGRALYAYRLSPSCLAPKP
ncbi:MULTISPECIES: glycosyltransferase family 39 protein [unclassified Rhizobium]|uniref:ArnT family glycosyltransferase n=1 Tax=unclassified Rhizobium TaxID=2613769 RepID=UPI000CDF5281|nr:MULTISPECIES: glycosyltransferase family 39 protein [Rhizobium]AVA20297.1 PMT family glycosyltransferase protein [Rhizobium sp. NXC24]MDK4740582.1 glycosyltransferase family 39 protein [Rhizobium sp. CNPSo 3464]UWU21589.1 glycosyltransferase family 39 protein [Rhizobium tropici]